jgi:hypothetical protein
MRWDSGQADNKNDETPAVASETRKGTVVEVCPFKLFGFSPEEKFKCEPRADLVMSAR